MKSGHKNVMTEWAWAQEVCNNPRAVVSLEISSSQLVGGGPSASVVECSLGI